MSLLQNLYSVAHEVSGLSIFVLCFGRLSTGITVVVYCGGALGSKSRALHAGVILEDSRLEVGLCTSMGYYYLVAFVEFGRPAHCGWCHSLGFCTVDVKGAE